MDSYSNTDKKYWIGTYQSAAQATCAYDLENVRLHFPKFDGPVPDLDPVPHHVASPREAREDREARERLETEQAWEAYMEELHCRYLERAMEEQQAYAVYAMRRGAAMSSSDAGPSAAPSSSAQRRSGCHRCRRRRRRQRLVTGEVVEDELPRQLRQRRRRFLV